MFAFHLDCPFFFLLRVSANQSQQAKNSEGRSAKMNYQGHEDGGAWTASNLAG